jgi:DNA replication and repair protein RecF
LVQHGATGLAVFGEVDVGEARHRLGVGYQTGKLEKRVEGEEVSTSASLAALLPVHVLDPSIHQLVEGGPSERRRFLDWGVFHVEHDYLAAWRRYRRVLSQRNASLKRRAASAELRPWNDELIHSGIAVDAARQRYVTRIGPWARQFGERLLGRALTIRYRSGWREGTALGDAIATNEVRDRMAGTTELGPHRADLVLELDGRIVGDEASRGQQKLTAAALVLAQVTTAAEVGGPRRHVLLVDDPAAELDALSLAKLLDMLVETPAQLILTGLSEQQLPPSPGFPVFHVEHGEVREL